MVDEGSEAFEQRVVATVAESIDELQLGAIDPVGDSAGEVVSLVGRILGPAARVAGVAASLAETCADEGLCDALGVHGVGAELAGEPPDALAGLGGEESQQRCLWRGDGEVGELGFPDAATRPVRNAEKKAQTRRRHVDAGGASDAVAGSGWWSGAAHGARLVAQANTSMSGVPAPRTSAAVASIWAGDPGAGLRLATVARS